MQNRYAGDVGDFGKLGLLRSIEKAGIKIGVNWYLVEDESHNQDGKHIGYLKDKKYLGCDDELLESLRRMLQKENRSIEQLEQYGLLNTKQYFHEIIQKPRVSGYEKRKMWHRNGLSALEGCDLVFLDPDNGLLPKSVRVHSDKSVKYVLSEEIIDYYQAGHSVMFYNHRTREKADIYLKRFERLFCDEALDGAVIKAVSFRRGTVRDYFFILHKEHAEKIEKCLENFLEGQWQFHFEEIDCKHFEY